MPLKIVRCGLNADKSREYLDEMSKIPQSEKVIFIVPDQFSYMAEKMLSEKFGGTGLNNKYVFTFRQMKRSFLNLNDKKYLSDSGKRMLLKLSAEKNINEDSVFFASKHSIGFLDSLYELLNELKRYCITPSELIKESERCENKILKNKLETIFNVYSDFEEKLKNGGFLDGEDDFLRVVEVLNNNQYFKDAHVWVDFFADFSPQHMNLLKSILKSGAKMSVFLPAKKDGCVFSDSLYEFPEKTVHAFEDMCRKENIEYSQTESVFTRKMKPAILAYADNFENTSFTYEKQANEIKIFQAKERYSEVEYIALKISDLVKDEGYKYSDIAVVCGDIEEYISFIEPVFFEYHIPYFSDYKVSMTEHPIAVLIASLFDILENNSFSFEACMKYLRTGLVVSDYEADLIENHVLKRGIRGNMWLNPKYWENTEKKIFDDITGVKTKGIDVSYMEEIRNIVVKPIEAFREKTKGRQTIKKMCTALFEFLTDIDLDTKIEEFIGELNSDGRENEALRFEQVWNFIIEITEQAVLVAGDEEISREEFYDILVSGMASCKISIIPQNSDSVSVSDVEAGVKDDIRALFVLGATRNCIPRISVNDGVLSDSEREEMECSIAPAVTEKSIQSEFKAVSLFASPTDILHVSFPASDINGTEIEPSQMVYDLLDSFKFLDKQDNMVNNNELLYISSPEATIHKLLLKMSHNGHLNPLWQKVKNWYEKNEGFEEKLRIIDTVTKFKEVSASLSSENARALYEDYTNYSISKIEKYFLCPFGYFLENGLKLREREKWEIGSTDTGSLLHWAVCEYCKTIDGESKDAKQKKANWIALTEEKSQEIVSEIMKRARDGINLPEYEAGKAENILLRIEKALKKSVSIINLSMQNSKYCGAAYEAEFEEREIKNSDGSVKIKGIIDRIDVFEDEAAGKAYIRIIDYKSGKKGYSIERILNRVDLQLAVYAIAAMDMYKSGELEGVSGKLEPVVKGIFYDRLHNKLVECSYNNAASAKETWLEQSKLDGVIFTAELGKGKSTYFDTIDAENMDFEIAQNGKSRYLKAEKKQKGQGLNKSKSSAESDEVKDAMLTYIRNGLIEADNRIKSGDIEVSPYKYGDSNESACRYCPYSIICAADRDKSPCRKREKSKQEVIEQIMGGGN